MEKYIERKNQLTKAMVDYIKEHGILEFPDRPTLNLLFCGEKGDEQLVEVYIQDVYSDTDPVDMPCVHTIVDGRDEYTQFPDFSNDEMEQILTACNIPVPPGESVSIKVEKTTIDHESISKSLQVLIDNGIEEDEAEIVLQALGYTLINTELFPGM